MLDNKGGRGNPAYPIIIKTNFRRFTIMLSKEEVIAKCQKNTVRVLEGNGSAPSLKDETVQGVELTEEFLTDMECSNAVFIKVCFIACVIEAASFQNATFISCHFDNCSIVSSNFLEATMMNTKFNNCLIHKGNFHQASISEGNFTDCEFIDAPIWEASLHNVSMNECNFNS